MPHRGKGQRCQYDIKNMDRAVSAVKASTMSIRKAAQYFKVPKSTLGDRLTGRVQEGASPGKQAVFPLEVEDRVSEKIIVAGKMGFGVTRAQLCFKMARLATALKLKTPFRSGVPGKDWLEGFRKRHPEISLRSPTPLNNVRARMLNIEVTKKYFEDLSRILSSLDLQNKPKHIWNIDETNVSLTHKPSKVLTELGQRNVPGRVGNTRDGVSVLACINAAGEDIPPLVIVKGLTEKAVRSYNVKEGPEGTKYTYQKKAWMEDVLGISWFQDHFLKHCGPERPQLIILDSHSSHETLGLIEVARENHISLFALPPHTTQYLNPLDKTVFGPFQREYNKTCTDFMSQSPNNIVTKWEWPRLFKDAYVKTVSKSNIMKGFEVCGIHPFNGNRIPSSAFAPSTPFDTMSSQEIPGSSIVVSADVHAPADTDSLPAISAEANSFPTNETFSVLATADENGVAQIDDPEALLELISSGKIDLTPQSWNTEIDAIFDLPAPVANTNKTPNKKKITTHRLLTSDDIYENKKAEQEEKEKREKEKMERKEKREQNRLKRQHENVAKKSKKIKNK